MKRVVIIANGTIENKTFHKKTIKNTDYVICADGGANSAYSLGIIPDAIIGDMDSISKRVLAHYKKKKKTGIIIDDDQDKTDLELAISFSLLQKPNEIFVLGAIGSRADYNWANILSLLMIPDSIKTTLINENNEINIVRKRVQINGKKGDTVSVIPLTAVKGLSYAGLKWGVKGKDIPFGWIGVSNVMTGKKATVSLRSGKALVIKVTK